MRIDITILSAPISVLFLSQVSPVSVELAGIGTLTVNNYYSEGGAGGYDDTEIRALIAALPPAYDDAEIRALIAALPEAYDDTEIRALIAALAAYDDTEIRALIDQRAQELGDYIGQNLSAFAQQISETDQRSRQNASAIQSINTAMLQIPTIQEAASQNSRSISTINATIGDIATILDAINGEEI